MSIYKEVRSVSPELSTPDLLRFLIDKKFPGKTLVTASLKAPSVAVLKMVADIDRATPVVFCVRGFQFPESDVYRARIVDLLGLKNVSQSKGGEAKIRPGDHDHCERMWAEHRDLPSRSFEFVHLNQALAPYSCWISAVYHQPISSNVTHRVDVEGRLIRVDPLNRWTRADVGAFMREHKLPFHPRAFRRELVSPSENPSLPADYHY
jgi:phosphoadenosine phosphosulfate reductase